MARDFKNIVIIGAGELARAMGKLLSGSDAGKSVATNGATSWWDADPAKVPGQRHLLCIRPSSNRLLAPSRSSGSSAKSP